MGLVDDFFQGFDHGIVSTHTTQENALEKAKQQLKLIALDDAVGIDHSLVPERRDAAKYGYLAKGADFRNQMDESNLQRTLRKLNAGLIAQEKTTELQSKIATNRNTAFQQDDERYIGQVTQPKRITAKNSKLDADITTNENTTDKNQDEKGLRGYTKPARWGATKSTYEATDAGNKRDIYLFTDEKETAQGTEKKRRVAEEKKLDFDIADSEEKTYDRKFGLDVKQENEPARQKSYQTGIQSEIATNKNTTFQQDDQRAIGEKTQEGRLKSELANIESQLAANTLATFQSKESLSFAEKTQDARLEREKKQITADTAKYVLENYKWNDELQTLEKTEDKRQSLAAELVKLDIEKTKNSLEAEKRAALVERLLANKKFQQQLQEITEDIAQRAYEIRKAEIDKEKLEKTRDQQVENAVTATKVERQKLQNESDEESYKAEEYGRTKEQRLQLAEEKLSANIADMIFKALDFTNRTNKTKKLNDLEIAEAVTDLTSRMSYNAMNRLAYDAKSKKIVELSIPELALEQIKLAGDTAEAENRKAEAYRQGGLAQMLENPEARVALQKYILQELVNEGKISEAALQNAVNQQTQVDRAKTSILAAQEGAAKGEVSAIGAVADAEALKNNPDAVDQIAKDKVNNQYLDGKTKVEQGLTSYENAVFDRYLHGKTRPITADATLANAQAKRSRALVDAYGAETAKRIVELFPELIGENAYNTYKTANISGQTDVTSAENSQLEVKIVHRVPKLAAEYYSLETEEQRYNFSRKMMLSDDPIDRLAFQRIKEAERTQSIEELKQLRGNGKDLTDGQKALRQKMISEPTKYLPQNWTTSKSDTEGKLFIHIPVGEGKTTKVEVTPQQLTALELNYYGIVDPFYEKTYLQMLREGKISPLDVLATDLIRGQ